MDKNELRKEWEHRVASYRASGLTQAKWCEENNLALHQLKYWLKRVEGRDSKSKPAVSFTPVVIDERTPPQNDKLLINVGDVIIEVKPGFNPTFLADVVRTLKTLC